LGKNKSAKILSLCKIFVMFLYFLLLLNAISFGAFGYDKYVAQRNKWRIPERTLLLLSFMGGSVGAVVGMFLFSHKISKPSFYVPVIFIIVLQVIVLYYFGWQGLMDVLR